MRIAAELNRNGHLARPTSFQLAPFTVRGYYPLVSRPIDTSVLTKLISFRLKL